MELALGRGNAYLADRVDELGCLCEGLRDEDEGGS